MNDDASHVRVDLQRPDGTTIKVVGLNEWTEMSAADAAGVVPVRFIVCSCGRRNDLPRAAVPAPAPKRRGGR